jgi:signal transduction histidine kinase/CheY-like chemotaxis protein
MSPVFKRIWQFLYYGTEDRELLLETSRNVIITTGSIYLLWHFMATLGWPQVFNPRLWLVSVMMLAVVGLSLYLLERVLVLAQFIWFTGLGVTILTLYNLFREPAVVFLFCIFPIMASAMVNKRGVLLIQAMVLGVAVFWNNLPFLEPLLDTYALALILSSLAMTALAWSMSGNLISAIEASSYHYRVAVERLEEARRHRAEISVLNKELSKSNFQLDRLNRMLTYARGKAEVAREERDRFAMSVSHELRSPLNFIIGFSDLMVNNPETYAPLEDWPPGLYEDVQEIYRSSMHLHSLINDILDMGKIDARQIVLFREKVSMVELIENVCKMVEPAVQQKGLALRAEMGPEIPQLYIDRTRIRQVMINLISNALRFTEQGSVTIRAFLKAPDWVQVEVEDTGSGIAKEDIPKVFTEFRQVGNENWRRKEGTGLGLAIGRRFIQLHNGEMGVESELERGSRFYFTLPVQAPSVTELEGEAPALVGKTTSAPKEQSPLLVFLSPDPFWARIFGETLGEYKVLLVSAASQLGAVCSQYYPRAVIIDRVLLNDPEVQLFIEKPPYDLPVVSFAIPVNLNRITNLPEGVSSYLIKPVARQDLVKAVAELGAQVRILLVVDDDAAMVRFVMQSLKASEAPDFEHNRYQCLVATRGQQAIEILQNKAVDAVLLDLELPDISGLVVLEALQSDPLVRKVPVVVVSANDLPQSLEARQRGMFEILLNRSFERVELTDILETVLRRVAPIYGDAQPPEPKV